MAQEEAGELPARRLRYGHSLLSRPYAAATDPLDLLPR